MARRFSAPYQSEPVSSLANWARNLAVFSVVAVVVSILIVRFGFLEMKPALATFFGALGCAALSILVSLAAFGARAYPGTKKWYGTSGNSFVAVVEFGDSVRARAVTAGGESGHPDSKHFNDQATRYATGDLRDVYFYPSQLRGHTEREYHPGS